MSPCDTEENCGILASWFRNPIYFSPLTFQYIIFHIPVNTDSLTIINEPHCCGPSCGSGQRQIDSWICWTFLYATLPPESIRPLPRKWWTPQPSRWKSWWTPRRSWEPGMRFWPILCLICFSLKWQSKCPTQVPSANSVLMLLEWPGPRSQRPMSRDIILTHQPPATCHILY